MSETHKEVQPETEKEGWNKKIDPSGAKSGGAASNPVDQALKKEKQPSSAEDLSDIHNTHEIGTSGGDQRAPDVAPPVPEGEDDQPGKPVRPIPVEEPGEGSAPEIEYDEPGKEPPVHTDE